MEMELLLLLTICLLMFSGKTFGNETGHVKIIIKEDEDVILPCSLKTLHEDYETIFDWKKDGMDVLFYDSGTVNPSTQHDQFKGRVFHFRNGAMSENASIKIIKTKVTDSGHYTCFEIIQGRQEERNQVALTVEYILKDRTGEKTTGAYAKPSVRTVNQNNEWALLKCEVLEAFPKPTVVLYNSAGNKVSDKEPPDSPTGHRYNVTLETKVTKTDNYTCVATQEELHHQFNQTAFVHFGGSIPMAIPSVRTVGPTDDGVLLSCEVFGASPKPTVVWYDSAGNNVSNKAPQIIDKGNNLYDVILETTVTKTDDYTCVATQEENHHQSNKTTHVNARGEGIGTLSQILIGVTGFLAVIIVVGCFMYFKGKSYGNRTQQRNDAKLKKPMTSKILTEARDVD